MDVLERKKIDAIKSRIMEECVNRAKHYIRKRMPDIVSQYTTVAELAEKAITLREVLAYQVILTSLNAINDLI